MGGLLEKVRVDLGDRSYNILIGAGLIQQAGCLIRTVCSGERLFVVTDTKVDRLHGPALRAGLERAGFSAIFACIPPGERQKSLRRLEDLSVRMAREGFDRGATVVAFGGGVIGDLAGFLSAVYMRGVQYVQVPTTLLACVDSSVGGKTAVNVPTTKNLIGAFHQPRLVIEDVGLLRTLSRRDVRAGAAELVKHGVILDRGFFDAIRANCRRLTALEPEFTAYALRRSCEIKAQVVSSDEREAGLRAVLNFGHTVGHAVEAVAGYGRLRHGEAVAIGMVAEARLSERIGFAREPVSEPIAALLSEMKLPTSLPADAGIDSMMTAMYADKKTRGGRLHVVLPRAIGRAETVPLDDPHDLAAVLGDMVRQARRCLSSR
ncbi:MAG: 3-dehydroquinate synthase [Armatimonadota bacterium]